MTAGKPPPAVDFAVSVADGTEAEDIVHRMSVRGCAVEMMLGQHYVHRLATIRLIRPSPASSRSSWTCSSAVQGSRARSSPARTAWKSGRGPACRRRA